MLWPLGLEINHIIKIIRVMRLNLRKHKAKSRAHNQTTHIILFISIIALTFRSLYQLYNQDHSSHEIEFAPIQSKILHPCSGTGHRSFGFRVNPPSFVSDMYLGVNGVPPYSSNSINLTPLYHLTYKHKTRSRICVQ